MAAVSSLSEKPVTTTTKELQSSGDSRPAVSRYVQTVVKEVLAWQRRIDNRRIPNRRSSDAEERKLGTRFAKLWHRRFRAMGKEPGRSQLSQSEASLVNSVPGVPSHGCPATGRRRVLRKAVSPHVETLVNCFQVWKAWVKQINWLGPP